MKFKTLRINQADKLIYGIAPNPVKTPRGLIIGGGTVYPELNFTVPEATVINRTTLPDIIKLYREIVSGALERALHLESNGLVLEFETLLEMTNDPFIGTEITKAMNEICEDFYQNHGLKSEIRLTPNDNRDFERPPRMRGGKYLDAMLELFEKGSDAGATILSIESTGGKEVCDEALMICDLKMALFALAVLGVRDMKFLWSNIAKIAKEKKVIPGGDTACGFANTAMVLADKGYIPKIFAAAIRIISAVRSMVAVEEGAIGPHKDCGYEGVYLKAITGIPIAMEGKTAACAHLSTIGNIASACADLWSNESVQHIKLLGGMAPTVFCEMLEYDCRLLNTARKESESTALQLRDLLIKSDVYLDPQAYVLSPDFVITVAQEMVKQSDHYNSAVKATLKGMQLCKEAIANGKLKSSERENEWLDRILDELSSLPQDESSFIEECLPMVDKEKCLIEEYGL